jgi:hypothetical protein
MKTTNRTVLDLSKVQHGSFWYVNQYGDTRFCEPKAWTVRGYIVSADEIALYHPDYPGESMLKRAHRLNIIDVWTPVCCFQLTANHSIVYTGKKAVNMWAAWRERIFNKTKGKK